MIGREIDRDAAARERIRQRLGRKQMPAGPAGGEQHQRGGGIIHQAGLPTEARLPSPDNNSVRGRSRVKASSMPMPQASEIIDEPP